MQALLYTLTWLFLVGDFCFGSADATTGCGLPTSGVYLSISSEAEILDSESLRWLELNWYGVLDAQDGDWVGLWSKDPSDGLDDFLMRSPTSGADGNIRTTERWSGSHIPSSVGDAEDSCLNYWMGYVRGGKLLHSSCLMIRPHWMNGLRSELLEVPVSEVVLPGTHDSGASGAFGLGVIGDLVGRWTFTQDESLWQQLVLGARYFDMRIAYYNNTIEKFFVNHGDVRIAPLKRYLEDVTRFMEQTQEIVIFDIHEASVGFNGHPERQEELMQTLQSYFGEWMAPRFLAPNPTMAELWESEARLIVTHPSASSLWNRVYHLWGDVNTLEDLEAYMYTGIHLQSGRGSLWSAMAEFTPSALDVTLNRWGGLRGAAAITNQPVTQWCRDDWWSMVNIVAMDFLPASDVVSIAITANKIKQRCNNFHPRESSRASRWWAHADIGKKNHSYFVTNQEQSEMSKVQVWLWVSALASTSPEGQITERQLEVNWEVTEIEDSDWIGIFDHNPSNDWSMPLEVVIPINTSDYFLAKSHLPHLPINTGMDEGACLGWWVAYVRNDKPLATDCVKVHPRWMSSMRDLIGDMPYSSLVIPGVHDAGTYMSYSQIAENSLVKYANTQDESIYNQLVLGNRYIDLRAGYFAGDPQEHFWVVHGVTVWRPLKEVLIEVRTFVEETSEVVLLDVGGFTFFNASAHSDCITLITEILGTIMAPSRLGWEFPVGQLLNSAASLIVNYDNSAANNHPLFWRGLSSRWANAQSLSQLEEYYIKVFNVDGPPLAPWTLSGQLTPLADDVVLDNLGGLRLMADNVNRRVTNWMRNRWWDKINIISCDFVLSAGYVDMAIEINIRRAT